MVDPETTTRELRRLGRLPYGPARTAATELLVRRIEAEGPEGLLPEALLELVEAYTFGEQSAKTFVPFARLVRLWDDRPDLFDSSDQHNFFWAFKWVAGDLPDHPSVTRAHAEALLDDMERRYRVAGKGLAGVAMSRFRWAWLTGQPDAEARRLAWITLGDDDENDCAACVIGQQVDFLVDNGRFDEAVQLGLTQDGECNLEPARTRYALALALGETGHPDDALATWRRARAALDTATSDFAPARAHEFELLARGGQLSRALRLLRDDYPQLLDAAESPHFHLRFLLGLAAGLSANLDAPDEPTGLGDLAPSVGALHALVLQRLRPLVEAFDARDGNDFYTRRLARALASRRFERPLPHEPVVSAAPADPPTAQGAPGASDLTLYALADALRDDDPTKPDAFARAAEASEAAGRLADAGYAWAESAQCLALADEVEAAHDRFGRAVPLLRAGGADPVAIASVLTAWAPLACSVSDPGALLDHLDAVRGAVAAQATPDDDGSRLGRTRRRDAQIAQALLGDTWARVVASAPTDQRTTGRDLVDAVAAATQAGETLGRLNRFTDAAHAFWLAGRLQRDLGETDASSWSLESAVEGFTAAAAKAAMAEAAADLIAHLRELGQHERADAVAAQLVR